MDTLPRQHAPAHSVCIPHYMTGLPTREPGWQCSKPLNPSAGHTHTRSTRHPKRLSRSCKLWWMGACRAEPTGS